MKHLFPLLLLGLLWVGCDATETPVGPGACDSALDQETLLRSTAYNVILPAYAGLTATVTDLRAAKDAFVARPDAQSLTDLRTAHDVAYEAWQAAAPFQFGPADEVFLRSSFNNFPLDETALEQRLSDNSFNFDQPDTYDKGLPAFDFLLYSQGDLTATLDYLQAKPNAVAFIDAQVEDLYQRTTAVETAWREGYRDQFVANTGTAAGTGLSTLINRLNAHYEGIKRERLGVPAGVLTIGIANPTKVEAYHSGNSLQLATKALEASRALYTGGEGAGLDDYLDQLNNAAAAELNKEILDRYAVALNAVRSLDGELSQLVQENQADVTEAYAEVTRQLIYTKTDLPALTCVPITYIDNPSDSD